MPTPDGVITREDVLEGYCSRAPTDPGRLDWELVPVSLRLIIRLRMHITRGNISEELIACLMALMYPDVDPPEVRGLIKVLDGTCKALGLAYRLEAGPPERQPAGHFEPYKLRLPFVRASLSLYIARGEFQWILRDLNAEPPPRATAIGPFSRMLLSGTQQWVRNGNR